MSINSKYVAMQSAYWAVYAVGYGFVAYYLQENGTSPGTVGFLMAAAGIIAAVFQPGLGKMTDAGKIGWRTLLIGFSFSYVLLNIILVLSNSGAVKAVAFGLFLALLSSFIPPANGASFYYERHGEKVNFGFARGMGSLCYAVLAYVLGKVTLKAGAAAVPVAGIAIGAALLAVLISMPCTKESREPVSDKAKAVSFVSKYPGFIAVVIGCTLVLSFHGLVCNYMINIIENAGGNSSHLGTAIAISGVLELPAMFMFAKIVKAVSAEKLLVISSVFFFIKSVIFLFASSVEGIYFAQVFQAVSFAVIIPASVFYSEKKMRPEDKMKGQAYMGLSLTVGSVIGSVSGGCIIQYAGVPAALLCGTGFALAGVVFVIAGTKGFTASQKTLDEA